MQAMSFTQQKHMQSKFSNNNDHSYLHKKFKKMASSIAIPSSEARSEDGGTTHNTSIKMDTDYSISNGSIAASHPEVEKIKQTNQNIGYKDVDKNVQITFNNTTNRLSEENNVDLLTGKTSHSNEFSNKTETSVSDFIKDNQNGSGGRYICPYCKLCCAKPSVLQKHIRAHTNERPYPCIPCGFAFKTKSNLYKHRRSRTHALRLQGADVSNTNDDDLSPGSESDTSLPSASISDTGSDTATIRNDHVRQNETSSPEVVNDRFTPPMCNSSMLYDAKLKSLYKPKFRAALYQENDDRNKKIYPPNADFLNEHISKIISDNEAIVDVIDTPLQKKYGKIKQIAESKQLNQISENQESKFDANACPLNLTKSVVDNESSFRKRSHSETLSPLDYQKHSLNPEGSIIKDLLLKTKNNGQISNPEIMESMSLLQICPLCQIPYRSAENLDIHRNYYCKGSVGVKKDMKTTKVEGMFVRSNSINVHYTESTSHSSKQVGLSQKTSKPENLTIIKPEVSEIIAPLPSPGPLLGNTRLVDVRIPSEHPRKMEIKRTLSPNIKTDVTTNYNSIIPGKASPRQSDIYSYAQLRCAEPSMVNLRSIDELSQLPLIQKSASLQMFGGEVKIVDHSGSTTTLRIEASKNQLSPISVQQNMSPNKSSADSEASVVVRPGLHSGGTIVHNPPTPKIAISTPLPHTGRIVSNHIQDVPHFQFPSLNAITKFNPLTLPPLSPSAINGTTSILHGGKLIPHVPGIPGPNTSVYASSSGLYTSKSKSFDATAPDLHSDNCVNIPMTKSLRSSDMRQRLEGENSTLSPNVPNNMDKKTILPIIKVKNVDEGITPGRNVQVLTSKPFFSRLEAPFKRNVDGTPKIAFDKDLSNNINKTKARDDSRVPDQDIRNFNFEAVITKTEIYNNQVSGSSEPTVNSTSSSEVDTSLSNERSETFYFQKNANLKPASEEKKGKFLRPSTLPLKPGTFTPKRHHGITPNANTMPLVSPETPRPAKAYGQLYLNGNAYTYLGLKCSTKVFYCTINRPQPTYVPNQHFLSMYSNWQLLSELTPDPLGLSTSNAMSLYDSRHRPQNTAVAKIRQELIFTHSSQWNQNAKENKQLLQMTAAKKEDLNKNQVNDNMITPKKELAGGFESNEDYTYIRGRGRGRYVCSECGIRCKKPSMLKKHIRTHTDVRPYTCTHCAFSFKTKGNLTKHMKSKAHYKKCCELGINPNEGNDPENGDNQGSGETDEDSDSEGDDGIEGETESSDTEIGRFRLPEHEAAQSLLSLGCSRPSSSAPGLITSARPSTYPYTPTSVDSVAERFTENDITSPLQEAKAEIDNQPMDLSKSEVKTHFAKIPTARESSVLASLASNTAKLPQQQVHWPNGEPMLHTYLTERALLDSKIKQSQVSITLNKQRQDDIDKPIPTEPKNGKSNAVSMNNVDAFPRTNIETPICNEEKEDHKDSPLEACPQPISYSNYPSSTVSTDSKRREGNTENAKFVVSEYLKLARINSNNANNPSESTRISESDFDENNMENDSIKTQNDHDNATIAPKVVVGAGGLAFKVTKGKDFENGANFAPGRLMEDGRRVCDFCNKTFTKPSQLRLHLNIHYMERPYRCTACAVSFRTRGHLQKHERSVSHHNKVSMTSTFGAATSLNPRPFRCSDCNIAFRIHGHLAKHLRSKMHVMRLECLCKLPFGTFTEIERAGVSLTDIDTTDCASSLASLQTLAKKLHEMDPSKLEYREPPPGGSEFINFHKEDATASVENICDSERDSESRTSEISDSHNKET